MKIIKNIFDKLRPAFGDGGSMNKMKPLYDALDNFCFSPDSTTLSAPHIRDPLDLKRYMSMVIIGLLPALCVSIYNFGILTMLPMIIVSYAAGGAVEVLFAVIRKEEIQEGFLVTGLLFPLVLPPTLPLWMVAAGVAFGVTVGKEVFGGTGRNLFNPALVGRCFLLIAYPLEMSKNWMRPGNYIGYIGEVPADAITDATPLVIDGRVLKGVASADELPSRLDMLFGNIAGSAGETSALALLIGGLFVMFIGVANWRTVASIFASFFVLAAILHSFDAFGDPLWHLCAGGLMLGAFFMAADPVSSPTTNGAKYLYGAIIGVLIVLFRQAESYPEGVMFAILLGNICAPILDEIVLSFHIRKLKNER